MSEKLLDIHVLKTILKTKVHYHVYMKLSTDIFTTAWFERYFEAFYKKKLWITKRVGG